MYAHFVKTSLIYTSKLWLIITQNPIDYFFSTVFLCQIDFTKYTFYIKCYVFKSQRYLYKSYDCKKIHIFAFE